MSESITVKYAPSPRLDDLPTINLPLSKSISNRLLVINALGGIETPRRVVAECDDTEAIVNALAHGKEGNVNVGAAGTAMRFLTAYYAVTPGSNIMLDGSARMRQRPIGELVDGLRQAGADIDYVGHEGYPPLHIKGKIMEGGAVEIDAGISSQFISSLLMAAPAMTLGLDLTLKGEPVSMPYIMMTLNMMAQRGARISMGQYPDSIQIKVEPGLYRVEGEQQVVEADWSAASYWYEMVALTGRPVRLIGLSETSLQGDAALSWLFEVLGVTESRDEDGGVIVERSVKPDVEEFDADMSETPDLAQTMMATCCGMGMPFVLTGLGTLVVKETNRLEAMVTELNKLGYRVVTNGIDEVSWDGEKAEVASEVTFETYKDHRMAMSLAPLAAVTEAEIKINDPEVVNKSYPGYWRDIEELGFSD